MLDSADDMSALSGQPSWPDDDSDGRPIQQGEFEHVVRLAARLAQAPIALLRGRRVKLGWANPALAITSAGFDRLHTACDLPGSGKTIATVPDTTQNPALWHHPAVTGELRVRFVACIPLIDADGDSLGVLSVIDNHPRPGLSDEQAESLSELAALAARMIERKRKAADLLGSSHDSARAEQLEAATARAQSCELALAGMLIGLCKHHRATAGFACKFNNTTQVLQPFGHFNDESGLGHYLTELGSRTITPDISHAAIAIQSGTARTLAFSGREMQSGYAIDSEAIRAGLRAEVIQPLHLLDERFGIVLLFDAPRFDLEAVADDVAAMTRLARPALYRKVAERRMRLLGTALDRANDAVLITEAGPLGAAGPKILYANASFCRQSGYALEEVLGRPHDMLQGAGTDAMKRLRHSMRRWKPVRAELLNTRKDGSEFWAEVDLTPISDEAGSITHWVSIQRDITDRRSNEAAQRQHEDSFRLLFQDNPLPAVVMNHDDLSFAEVNDAAVRQYGWSRAEFLGKKLTDLSPSGEPVLLGPAVAGTIGGASGTHIRADGSVLEVRAFTHDTVYDGQDALLAVLWDVTDLEAARRDMHHANELLRERTLQLHARTEELAEAQRLALLGNWRVPVDWRDPSWTRALSMLLDAPRDAMKLRPADQAQQIHEEDQEAVRKAFESAAQDASSHEFEYRVVMLDGQTHHFRAEVRPVLDSDGDVIELFGYSQDITESKRAEQALLRNESLRALGQLTGGVAHDFNNLLTVVILNLEEAREQLPEADELQDVLQPALHAAVRGSELTSQLLSYARRATLRPERVRPDEFFGALRPLLNRVLGERFELQVLLRHDGGSAMVDPAQLDSAVMNLVINARDAMPKGGQIVLETRSVTLGGDSIGFQDEVVPGRYVVISVADQGEGIPAHLLARVFEPFFTTKEAGKGSGMGLSMVYGFARQSGGHVTIDSKPGRGTTVRLFLPVPASAADEAEEAANGQAEWRAAGLRALVVEDQQSVLQAVSRMLRQLGFEVVAASAADAALQHLDADGPFDLLFSDIVLPGAIDGVGLAGETSRRSPDTRILLTSGFTEHNLASTDEAAPGVEFLMKPYKRQDLQSKFATMFPRAALQRPQADQDRETIRSG